MLEIPYNRHLSVNYATNWANRRNPEYYNFDRLGGDCTNFISQCVFAGGNVMNYSKNGWYYNSITDRAPAWTGVNEFFKFITSNKTSGPFGYQVEISQLQIGDLILLGRNPTTLYHSLFISKITDGKIFVCAHTRDALNISIQYYPTNYAQYIHIQSFRK